MRGMRLGLLVIITSLIAFEDHEHREVTPVTMQIRAEGITGSALGQTAIDPRTLLGYYDTL